MFLPESRVRVWLYAWATDMRKSFTGLSALAKHALGEEPTSGDLFAFINRRRTYMKVLYFDRGGYCLWSKRLERGQFHYPQHQGAKVALDITGLKLLLEGIDARDVRRYRRYEHRDAAADHECD
jgi:transposase